MASGESGIAGINVHGHVVVVQEQERGNVIIRDPAMVVKTVGDHPLRQDSAILTHVPVSGRINDLAAN